MKFSSVLILAFWLAGCSIFGAPTEIDETKGWSAERIYQEADAKYVTVIMTKRLNISKP